MAAQRVDYDSPWKEILERFFPQFWKGRRGEDQDRISRRHPFTPSPLQEVRGYSREEIVDLFRFIDWLMILPVELERALRTEVEAYEEAQRMRYVSTIERMAEQRGLEQAFRRGTLDILEERFGAVPESIGTALAEIEDTALLQRLLRQAVTVESPAAFMELVQTAASGAGAAG